MANISKNTVTRGTSSRRTDARFGSAHARNHRGCRQIEAVNTIRYRQGVHQNKSSLIEDKENTGIRINEPATNLAIRHTMTNSSRKQQHCCCSNISTGTHRAAAAAALCMHIKLTSRLLRRLSSLNMFTLVRKYMAPTKKK